MVLNSFFKQHNMKKIAIYICYILLLFVGKTQAQEMNVKLTINTDKIQGIDKAVFTSLESSLVQMLNERKWTDTNFGLKEKIEATFVLTLSSVENGVTYNGDLQVSSRRPVYNTTYITPIFAYKDNNIKFDYTQGESLEFNESNLTNNLVSIFAYYTYIVIGLDFDSFALNGGKPYFEKAVSIVNESQSLSPKGWSALDDDKNRYALALALTEESSSKFHSMWYTYHRLGMDEMAINVIRARDQIINSLQDLQTIYSARPASPIILFYGDTKLDELVSIYSDVSDEERKSAYELLRKIFPTKNRQLNLIRSKSN